MVKRLWAGAAGCFASGLDRGQVGVSSRADEEVPLGEVEQAIENNMAMGFPIPLEAVSVLQ